jgi:hypothetical protein
MANVIINGKTFELQPFTAGQLRREASAKLAAIEDISNKLGTGELTTARAMPELVGNACELVLMSLRNGGAEITIEDVESLDFGTIQAAVRDAVEASCMAGEAKPQPAEIR